MGHTVRNEDLVASLGQPLPQGGFRVHRLSGAALEHDDWPRASYQAFGAAQNAQLSAFNVDLDDPDGAGYQLVQSSKGNGDHHRIGRLNQRAIARSSRHHPERSVALSLAHSAAVYRQAAELA